MSDGIIKVICNRCGKKYYFKIGEIPVYCPDCIYGELLGGDLDDNIIYRS